VKVRFRQSGGLAWTAPRSVECDSEAMGTRDARRLRELVDAAGIAGSEERLSRDARDAERYEVTVCDGLATHRLVCDAASVTAELAPLLDYLRERARPETGAARGAPR
jgi:hypothetical protein